MLIFENEHRAIYNFNLSIKQEALILNQFIDEHHEILFPFWERNFEFFPELKKYIEDRTIIKSTEDVFDISNSHLENALVYWYSPRSLEELEEIIRFDRITYRCLIIKKGGALSEYRFKLFAYEHAEYKGKETRVLWIEEAVPQDYAHHIYSKISQKLAEMNSE